MSGRVLVRRRGRALLLSDRPRASQCSGCEVLVIEELPTQPACGPAHCQGLASWSLERAKSTHHNPQSLALCHRIAEGWSRSAGGCALFELPVERLDMELLAAVLTGRGLVVRGEKRRRIRRRLAYVVAAFASLSIHLLLCLCHARPGRPMAAPGGAMLAVHGEWSTRTRHVLSAMAGDRRIAGILLIGRPVTSLAEIKERWRSRLGHDLPELQRPLSPLTAVRALRAGAGHLRDGWGELDTPQACAGLGELTRQCYRHWLGAANAAWWQAFGERDVHIFYGHTGLADTSLLELAQQRSGCHTVHLVHGLCSGFNFDGISSLAVFRCDADRRLYQGRSSYAAVLAGSSTAPPGRTAGKDLVLLSNCIHPQALARGADVLGLELSVLEQARAIAELTGAPAGCRLLWKPHPAIDAVPAELRRRVRQGAAELGWTELEGPLDDPAILAARMILSTPSSAIVELLAQGCLPIMLDLGQSPEQSALIDYPLRMSDAQSVATWFKGLAGREACTDWYTKCWENVGPAPLPVDELLERAGQA